MKTLNYLDTFYKKAEGCIDDMYKELPQVAAESLLKPIGKRMWLVNFSSISGGSWSVQDILLNAKGRSKNLTMMCDKIQWIFHNSPPNVTPFIKATAKRGYFWDARGITKSNKEDRIKIFLTENEITRLEMYISDNI